MAQITQAIKAVIFDMDGVITDTVHYHYLSWKRLAEEENIPFTIQDNEKLLGLTRPDSLAIFLKGRKVDLATQDELLTRKNSYFLELIENFNEKNLLPGVTGLLDSLKNLNLQLAVASSSRNAELIINKLGLKTRFNAIIDGHCTKRGKPAPALFLLAAKALNVQPQECIVVEDSQAGIQAGLAAGMRVIGIGPENRVKEAHFHFSSLLHVQDNLDLVLNVN